ncbi:protein tyrosine phosphatase [Hansschlegelia sp.]|uniref:tyrosine phosphatase family protein n=1 Tax=Hansschlegelia sp. TaxID=2041892 RepID=UPI002C705DF6|nr:protein tyrosine phosphatase [Hansschlegelia sp.]HVI28905.1 protein tyrosine phosphatase [Hansschlegelia sp.]
MIAVCPLSRLAETIVAARARRVLSLLSLEMAAPRLPGIAPEDHLTLRFHDIVEPTTGHVHPCDNHVAEALAFAAGPDPIVVHCYAGISRSTAMAFAIACAREPSRDERDLAAALRRASPMATPNRLIVRLADDALGRQGRMAAAIAAIGRGEDAFEGAPFTLAPAATP